MSSYLLGLTDEQRAENLEKARLARIEKKLAGENLRQGYMDEQYHRGLASEVGLRMPAAYLPNSDVKYLKRALKHLNIDVKDYLEACGVTTLKKLVEMNPSMSAVEEIGLLLEHYKEKTS